MSVRWTLSSAQLASMSLIGGKNGVNLYVPESYLGLGVPDMSNFIIFVGPTWPVENNTVTGPLLSVPEYAIQIIKMQKDHIKSWVPKQDIIDSFNEPTKSGLSTLFGKRIAGPGIKTTILARSMVCSQRYTNISLLAVWPSYSLHYIDVIAQPRYEDFEIKYEHKNPWVNLSMGYALANGVPDSDVTPYLQLEKISLKWFGVVGAPKVAAKVEDERSQKEKTATSGELRSS